MLNLFRRKADPSPFDARALLKALIAEAEASRNWYCFDLKDSETGRQVLAVPPEDQCAFVLAVAGWLRQQTTTGWDQHVWILRAVMFILLRHRLPFAHDDVLALLDWSIREEHNYLRGTAQMFKVAKDYLEEHPDAPEVRTKAGELAAAVESGSGRAEDRRWAARLRELAGQSGQSLPLVSGEVWSDAALADIRTLDPAARAAWSALLRVCVQAGGGAPTAKWLKTAQPPLESVGLPAFRQAILRWFPLVDPPRPRPSTRPAPAPLGARPQPVRWRWATCSDLCPPV